MGWASRCGARGCDTGRLLHGLGFAVRREGFSQSQSLASKEPCTVVPTLGESVRVPETEPCARSAFTAVSFTWTFEVLGPAASYVLFPLPGFE